MRQPAHEVFVGLHVTLLVSHPANGGGKYASF